MFKRPAKRGKPFLFSEELMQQWPYELRYPTITLPRFPTTASLFNLGVVRKRVRKEVHEARAKAEEG